METYSGSYLIGKLTSDSPLIAEKNMPCITIHHLLLHHCSYQIHNVKKIYLIF